MVESILHLFKIHRKMIFGNPSIIVQDMFSKTPKTFNTVNVILGALVDQFLGVINRMMFAQTFKRVVASEGVGIVDRTLSSFLSDDSHEFFFGDMLHNPRVYLAIALQEAKYDVFAGCASTALAFPPAAKIALVHLDLTIQFASFKFGNMVNCFSQLLIDAGDRLIIAVEVMRQAVCRLLLVESLHDTDFSPQTFQRFLFSTAFVSAPHVSALRTIDLERTAENTLLSSQKVGRAPENVLSSLCHMDILVPYGYETH